MRGLPGFSVHRPVTVIMGFLALLVLGVIAWTRIPLEMMPGRFSVNQMWIWVPYKDSTPRENVKALVQPIEEQISTAPGLKSMESRARAGSAQLTLEFHRSISMDAAYNALVDRMERAMAELPADVERYYVYKWNPSDEPVIWGGISFPDDVDDPYYLVTEVVQKHLERVPGVGLVEAWGVNPRQVYVDFDLERLSAHGISLYDVIQRLGGDNFQVAAGRIEDRGQVRYVRSLALWESLDELREWPLRDGLVLGDVAEVSRREALTTSIAHIDGKEAAALAISKESDANTVAVGQRVAQAFAELEHDPRALGAHFVTFFDQGELIHTSITDLLETAGYGGVFAVIVLFAFLREWRMTLLIAASMPFTLLLTVTVLYFSGRTLNLLSLMGLMLAVGMVVDNAIVVVEAIYARRHQGDEAEAAAIEGTAEVTLAITLATLTTVVVFLPVILMSEDANFSFFMGELGMPVVIALGASLLVALIFTPLSTTLLRGRAGLRREPAWITALIRRYQAWLRWVLTHRTDALVGVVAVVILTVMLPFKAVSCESQADGNIGEFVIRYKVPDRFTYEERAQVVDTFESYVDAHREAWGVRTTRSRLRSGNTRGTTWVYLDDDADGVELSREEVIDQAKEDLPDLPGVDAQVGWSGSRGGDEHVARLVLRGDDMETLDTLGAEVQRVIEGVPGVLGVAAGLEEGNGEEVRLRADRDALARYGLSAQRVGQTVAFALRGAPLPDFRDGDKEVDVLARFRLEDRADLDTLLDFPMFSGATGSVVPLRAVVHPEIGPGTGTIHREDRTTAWPLSIDVDRDTQMSTVMAGIQGAMSQVQLPDGYSWDMGGRVDEDAANNAAQLMALVLSITFVFLIMGVLFESFLLPLAVITAVPMALLGVYWTLYLTGTPLDVMGGVGLVILVGVVVNNGIVLIDLVTRLRHEGAGRTQALVEAGGRRLRPILMTALTTIFGLLPMAMGSSSFIGIPYAPLGRVVAGGLAAGTVLTLFFVPYLYSVLDDIRGSAGRWLAWVLGRRDAVGSDTAETPAGGPR